MSIPEQVNGEPVLAFMSGDGKGYAVTFRASDGVYPVYQVTEDGQCQLARGGSYRESLFCAADLATVK